MRYVISDIHGEYELFLRLLDKISFSETDELYVCGDIIEKGAESIRLAELIFSMSNVHVIMGNHEHSFLQYYNYLMREYDCEYDAVLSGLQKYITDGGGDGELLNWDIVDSIESLPYYIETEDFICVHAGVLLTEDGRVQPLDTIPPEELLCSRSFKNTHVVPKDSKCVFFGHTATSAICGEPQILVYKRPGASGRHIRDYAKIHLDTCTFVSGVLGCFGIESCEAYYVKRK